MHSSSAPQWVRRAAAVTSAGLIAAGLWGAAPASATACVLQGGGTVGDPYQVATRADLEQVEYCSTRVFLQTADINLAVGGDWIPLVAGDPGFTGTYDGGSHAITNMTTETGATNRGLFAKSTGATIKNLSVTGATIDGGDTVGSLVAESARTTIADITVTGAVTGGTNVGGVVGSATQGTTLTRVSFSGTVTGGFSTGGILGFGDAVTVTDLSVTGTTVTGGKRTGGLVGLADNSSTISRAAVTATITGSDINTGGLVGENRVTSIGESTATVDITGTETAGGLVGLNDAGTVSSSSAAGTLQGVTKLGGAVGHSDGGIIEDVSAAVDVEGFSDNIGGLAGELNSSTVTDTAATGSVSGAGNVGGLVGYAHGLTAITGSQASGAVTASARGGGGLVGRASGTPITQSNATGNVIGTDSVGGLVGVGDGTWIHESFATGAVEGAEENVGGLVGNLTSLSGSVEVKNSYATGAVRADNIGGGLIGATYRDRDLRVANNYAVGSVTVAGSPPSAGGLIGYTDVDVEVSQSFWDSTVNPTLVGGAGTPKTASQLRAKATFGDAGWSIQTGGGTPVDANLWGICVPPAPTVNSGYPFLLWQDVDDPCPTVPAAPTLTPLTAGDATLAVAAQLGDDGGLPVTDVEYQLDDGPWKSSGGVTGSFTIKGLTNGTTYRVRVRAVNELGHSDPSNERSGTPSAAPTPTPTPTPTSTPTPMPTPTPTPETTLLVNARAGAHALKVGRRTVLVRSVRTNGTVTSVHASCTVKGQRLPRRVREQLCGLNVVTPAQSSGVSATVKQAVRVSAKPSCSRGLRMQVRIAAKAAGAKRQVFTRGYRVDRTPGVTCRIKGTG